MLNPNNEERIPVPENLRLGSSPRGKSYDEAEAHLARLKARANDSDSPNTGHEPRRPARHGTEDGRLDRLIAEAERELGRG